MAGQVVAAGIPQYAIVAVFAGGAAYTATGGSRHAWQADALSGGRIGLLVCFAAITLLVAVCYPKGLYHFVIGMNRGLPRVIAHRPSPQDKSCPTRSLARFICHR